MPSSSGVPFLTISLPFLPKTKRGKELISVNVNDCIFQDSLKSLGKNTETSNGLMESPEVEMT